MNQTPNTCRPISFWLHLPPAPLNPNARPHWAAKARAVKNYRNTAWLAAAAALGPGRPAPRWTRARVVIVWYTKTDRHPDRDNALASLKAAFDGLTDAGIITDDKELFHEPIEFRVDAKRPRVEITVTEESEL
jgi:crossover junction endodeoxyribonuclease RusA